MDGYDGQLLLCVRSRVCIEVASHGEHITEGIRWEDHSYEIARALISEELEAYLIYTSSRQSQLFGVCSHVMYQLP